MDIIKEYATRPPFNIEANDLLTTSVVPMEAIYTYDAVKVYALALHRILQRQGDVCNGTDIVQTIIEMGSYPSDIQGINVTINQDADSMGTSMLLAMVSNPECGSKYEKVGDFHDTLNSSIPILRLNTSKQILATRTSKNMEFVLEHDSSCKSSFFIHTGKFLPSSIGELVTFLVICRPVITSTHNRCSI